MTKSQLHTSLRRVARRRCAWDGPSLRVRRCRLRTCLFSCSRSQNYILQLSSFTGAGQYQMPNYRVCVLSKLSSKLQIKLQLASSALFR